MLTEQCADSFRLTAIVLIALLLAGQTTKSEASERIGEAFVNSLSMRVMPVPAGSFMMGGQTSIFDGWYEKPAHRISISRPFLISETEVTLEQFRKFRPEFPAVPGSEPYVSGVSWSDAVAFCEWLSKRENRTYRLPTEAEWEYACRASTATAFWSGESRPEAEMPNPWGLKNTHTGVREWCLDWFAAYPEDAGDEIDPVGTATGMARVVRGGGLDNDEPSYAQSASRAGIGPGFGWKPVSAKSSAAGLHRIGFRVVLGLKPETPPRVASVPFPLDCVRRSSTGIHQGPDPDKPWYRKRWLLTTPPENVPYEDSLAAGLEVGIRHHNHSPALEVCPNGDLLLVIYTSIREYEPEVSLLATRLRYGAEEWDMPEIAFDFPGVNDHAPNLWADRDSLHLFWGSPNLQGAYPFNWMSSKDNGATWSEVRFPQFRGTIGPHSRQPINTAFRSLDGTICVASDGVGGSSVLWASCDNGKTWFDTGGPGAVDPPKRSDLKEGLTLADGRSAGRHTCYVQLKDGSILAMGGKNTHIDGHMPKAISRDGGKSWVVGKTPFSSLGGRQRPCLIRLRSGRLFFCSDMHSNDTDVRATDIRQGGAFVALSDDEGKTWRTKMLPGALPFESGDSDMPKDSTLGYSVARQAPNGVIHVVTTMNNPCLHFELNEAWILSEDAGEIESKPAAVFNVRTLRERYPSGRIRAVYSFGNADDGRQLLDGHQTYCYEDSSVKWSATFSAGRKVGLEKFYRRDGSLAWSWNHGKDGLGVCTRFWPNGKRKSESSWTDGKCEGTARMWDMKGNMLRESQFSGGRLKVASE